MRVANTLVLNEKRPLQEQIRDLQTQLDKVFDCLQGRVSFGTGVDGVSGQNIEGEWQAFTVSAGANVEFNVAHTIGSVPLGYIVISQDKAGNLYQQASTGTSWTSSQISLKSTVDAVTYLIFLVKKGT
jgi:hypothetical protein